MEQAGMQTRPVPAPRRLYTDLQQQSPANYENIEINNANNINNNRNCNIKKLNINAENLHDLGIEKKLPPSSHHKLILQENNTEPQPIYSPDANENVPTEPVYATPKPAPRQRAAPEISTSSSSSPPLRAFRAAPQVPPKPLNIEQQQQQQRYSISSEFSTTSATHTGQAEDESWLDDCSESSQQSGKFQTPSPGYVDDVPDSKQQLDDLESDRSDQSELLDDDNDK